MYCIVSFLSPFFLFANMGHLDHNRPVILVLMVEMSPKAWSIFSYAALIQNVQCQMK
jgi:hypothetical protein